MSRPHSDEDTDNLVDSLTLEEHRFRQGRCTGLVRDGQWAGDNHTQVSDGRSVVVASG
jgi:hypothetical protein